MVTTLHPDGGGLAEGVWKVAGDSELLQIAAAGTGFVIDPGNRWWHTAACSRIEAMTTGAPKWYAATPAAREAFLELRVARYATAQPVRPARLAPGEPRCRTRRLPGPVAEARRAATAGSARAPGEQRLWGLGR